MCFDERRERFVMPGNVQRYAKLGERIGLRPPRTDPCRRFSSFRNCPKPLGNGERIAGSQLADIAGKAA